MCALITAGICLLIWHCCSAACSWHWIW